MEHIVMRSKKSITPPRHSRTYFNAAKLQQLCDNIKANGLMNPIEILPSGEIISGHRRWQAMMLDDEIDEVPVRIISDPISALQIRVRRISENLQRVDAGLWDKYLEIKGFFEDMPGISSKEIANLLNKSESSITRYLSLDRCIDEVRDAVKARQLGVKKFYEIAKAKPERQAALLAKALGGSAAEVAEARTRDSGEENGTVQPGPVEGKPKPLSFRIDLPDDQAVIVKGADCYPDAVAIMKRAMQLASKAGVEAKSKANEGKKQKGTPSAFEPALQDHAMPAVFDTPAGRLAAV
jgi:ParB/RepB/Spo0J family partition protein